MGRGFVWSCFVACLIAAALWPASPRAQAADRCTMRGTIASGRIPLPGVVVALIDAEHHQVDVSSTTADGAFALSAPFGEMTLTAELVAFARVERSLSVDASTCSTPIALTMTLASRAATTTSAASPRTAATPPAGTARQTARSAPGGRQSFQNLALVPDQIGLSRPETAADPDAAAQLLLPPGFSPETSAESVTAIGSSQPAAFFGPNGPGDFAERFGNQFPGLDFGGGDGAGGAAGRGGPGGGRAGFGGPGGGPFAFGGPLGRGGRGNQIRGSFFQSFDTSALDTAPYPLNGQAPAKPDYFQQRFGATLGGPLKLTKSSEASRTFFFLNYTGNHSHNPFDAYSTVPTLAERSGDLSAFTRAVVDPATGQPFAGNQIPAARFDPAAVRLLNLFPLPNQATDRQNFRTVTTNSTQTDDINVRIVHPFGAPPARGQGGRGRGGGGGRGGPGFGGGSNLNVAIHYRRADSTNANAFPTLGGSSSLSAWDVPVSLSFSKGGVQHIARFEYNRQQSAAANAFAFTQDVAGIAGVNGVSIDPFDWGSPNVSLSSFTSLRDVSPSTRTDRTIAVGDTIVKVRARQTIRFGGDYRDIRADSRVDQNARGSFVFTGLFSGVDFGDFLLGLPQQSTVQFGPGVERFRSRSWDLFAQDDWRLNDKVTVNAGLRYEYFSPLSEANNRLATLDVAPGFTAAVPVLAGQTGPYSGAFSDTIVNPFRAGFAPRIGVAWRAAQGTVLRAGYGINYNAGVYQSIATQLAGQPPFAVTNTALATPASPLPLETALLASAPGTATNTFAVDPNYRLGFVQIWNVDLQRNLSQSVNVGVGYTGTKGGNLDLLRAPNRGPSGLLLTDVGPFVWESSGADSIMNSVTLRVRKRLTSGIAAGLTYTLSKSIDDASSVGGSGGVVAQNDQDLAAERGLSSFDQRHRLSGDFTYELPFGANRRWLTEGAAAQLFGNWVVNGNVQFASGTPFTARILGSVFDVAKGTNGTLRANYDGEPIPVADPTTALFFNTAAFSIPAPGTFGNAGRNTIIGPGTSVLNLGVTKNVNFSQTRGLSIQVLASNVLNTLQFASIDTVVNSPTFGQVTAVRPMRRIQILTRFRF